MKRILILALLFSCWAVQAQQLIPLSVKELAPDFGIRPIFLDDTVHVSRYLDSLPQSNSSLTDTCVTLNAKLMAMENVLRYDYRHADDTVWIDATHFLEDYDLYMGRIKTLSEYVLGRAHRYIESEHIRQDNSQQSRLNLRKDTIFNYHQLIIQACDGIGVTDKERKKQLRDIYYSYLSVYNRYDFSMKAKDSSYLTELEVFSEFQQHLYENVLSSNNYTARINNFVNTLRVRCGRQHTDVIRSYQRKFRSVESPIRFSSIREYHKYIDSVQSIIEVQNAWLDAIQLREEIEANGKHINELYNPKYAEAAKTYAEAAALVNTIPEFTTADEASNFLRQLNNFAAVQQYYINDYDRLMAILHHGDSIRRRCGLKYGEVARAYKTASDHNPMLPNYQSVIAARKFALEMSRFEMLQRLFDTIIDLRIAIDNYRDSISKGWMQHLIVYNGFQYIRRQFVLVPTFIDVEGGQEFVSHLEDYLEMEQTCMEAIRLYYTYKQLGEKLTPDLQSYRYIRRAYQQLESQYITVKTINLIRDLAQFIHQMEGFITVQEAFDHVLHTNGTLALDERLKDEKDPNRIERLLGL